MPLYKFVGNRILTTLPERAWRAPTSREWHSGYRAYSVAALAEHAVRTQNPDGFDFDTQVILQLHEAGKRIVEVPIPTYYGDEICHVNGIGYAWRRGAWTCCATGPQRMGFGSGELAFASMRVRRARPTTTRPRHSRHAQLGRSSGARAHPRPRLCRRARRRASCGGAGHHVTGVDVVGRATEVQGAGRPLRRGRPRRRAAGGRPGRRALRRGRSPPTCSSTCAPPQPLLRAAPRRAGARAGRSSSACRTSATGTRGSGSASAGSTTTGAASSDRGPRAVLHPAELRAAPPPQRLAHRAP